MLCGHTCVCAVEIEPYPRKVLMQRQRDGILPRFPVWDDVTTFDGNPWRGHVAIICGGFPCQDISAAGKGAGITGERSGLWKEFARIIGEVRPRYVLVENSPMLTLRGLGTVLGDLAEMGYDADWCVLGAVDAGAPHKRDRIWILAYSNIERGQLPIERKLTAEQITRGPGSERSDWTADAANAESWRTGMLRDESEAEGSRNGNELSGKRSGLQGTLLPDTRNDGDEQRIGELREVEQASRDGLNNGRGTTLNEIRQWWAVEPDVGRVAHGVASRVDRLKAIGNGQVPAVVKLAWDTLTKGIPT